MNYPKRLNIVKGLKFYLLWMVFYFFIKRNELLSLSHLYIYEKLNLINFKLGVLFTMKIYLFESYMI